MYSVFFFSLSILFTYYSIEQNIIFLWPAANTAFFGLAYLFNKPMLFAKSQNGRINILIHLINLPWLFFTTAVWRFGCLISKEAPFNKIPSTNITIGRRLLKTEFPDEIEIILDLTCEFNECLPDNKEYINLPLLDGIAPPGNTVKQLQDILPRINNKQIYIHCAQGHGRTATITTLLLVLIKKYPKVEDAYKCILENRPKANMSRSQKRNVLSTLL